MPGRAGDERGGAAAAAETRPGRRRRREVFPTPRGRGRDRRGGGGHDQHGAWPNDPFFLYFGFVPENNPNDSAILFRDAEDAARCAARAGLVASEADAAEIARGLMNETKGGGDDADDDEDEEEGRGMMRRRMVLTRAGEVDAGVVRVAEALGVAWMDLVERGVSRADARVRDHAQGGRAKLAECEGGRGRSARGRGRSARGRGSRGAVPNEQEGGAAGTARGCAGEGGAIAES